MNPFGTSRVGKGPVLAVHMKHFVMNLTNV